MGRRWIASVGMLVGLGLAAGGACQSTPPVTPSPTEDVGATPKRSPFGPRIPLREAYAAMGEDGGQARLLPLDENLSSWTYRWRVLDQTKKTLDVTYFLLEDDVFGQAFFGKILELARRGVHVRVLLDSRGSVLVAPWALMGENLDPLIATGNVEVRWAGPLVARALQTLTTIDINPILASNHDKLIISDRQETIIGGRNIGRDYFVHPKDLSWVFSDVDLSLVGRASSAAFERAFVREWDSASAHAPNSDEVPGNDHPLLLISAAMDRILNGRAPTDEQADALLNNDAARTERARILLDAALESAPDAGLLARATVGEALDEISHYPRLWGAPQAPPDWYDASLRVLDSRTRPGRPTIDAANEEIIQLVRGAERELVILNPYVVLTQRGLEVLREISARGVSVTVFTNSPASSDSSTTQALFLRMWPEILAAAPTMRLYVLNGWRPLHGKVAIIDGAYTLLGSYNLDYVSAFLNGEVGIVVDSVEFATSLRKRIFDRIDHGEPPAVEYKILRDAEGRVVRHPRSDLLRGGRPVEAFGPADHCDAFSLARLWAIQRFLDTTPGIFTVPLM